MTNDFKEAKTGSSEVSMNSDRRTFMRDAAAAGLLGAAAMTSELTEPRAAAAGQQQAATGGQRVAGANRPQLAPALDMRHPVSYSGVADAVGVLMNHFKALSQRDMKSVADTLQFPYGTFEQTDLVVVKTPEDLLASSPASLNMSDNPERFTDHDGYMKAGTYDVFGGIEVFNCDPIQVNLSMSYDRYSSSGNKLLQCNGVYCVTNNDGKWGIQLMSTIFTPAQMEAMEFPDSIEAAKRLRQIHTWSFQMAWQAGVWSHVRQLGLNAGVNAARNGTFGFSTAPSPNNGVKNRLQVTNYTQESLDAITTDFKATRDKWKLLGLGNWGWDWGGGPPARVIHASVNKVHMYQGATRFTAAGEFISNTEEIDVLTLVQGRWGMAGILGYIMNHDRSGDLKNIKL